MEQSRRPAAYPVLCKNRSQMMTATYSARRKELIPQLPMTPYPKRARSTEGH